MKYPVVLLAFVATAILQAAWMPDGIVQSIQVQVSQQNRLGDQVKEIRDLVSQGKLVQAGALAESSLKLLPPGDTDLRWTLTFLLSYTSIVENPEAALNWARDALSIAMRMHSRAHAAVSKSAELVGTILFSLDRAQEALPYLRQAVDVNTSLYRDKDQPELASSLYHFGICLDEIGRSVEAIPYLEQSVNAYLRISKGQDSERLAMALNAVGLCLDMLGRSNEALSFLQQAIDMNRRLGNGQDDPDLAASINNLGRCLDSLGEFGKAHRCLREALDMRVRLYKGDNHPDVLNSLNNIGAFLVDSQGNFDEAKPYFERALKASHGLYQDIDHTEFARSLNNLGVCLDYLKLPLQAEPLLHQGLEMRRRLFGGEDHPDVATSLMNIAVNQYSLGRLNDARVYRSSWILLQVNRMRRMLLLADAGLTDHEASGSVYYVASFSHDQIQLDYAKLAMLRHLQTRTGTAQQLGDLVSKDIRLTELRGKSEEMSVKVQDLAMSAPEDSTPDDIKKLRSMAKLDADAAYARYANAVREKFGDKLQLVPPSLEQVQAKLGSDGAVVDFYRRTDRDKPYYLAVVTLGSGKPHFIKVGSEEDIEAAVKELQDIMNNQSGNAEAKFAQLDELTFRPLDDLIKGKKRVYVVADGVIAQIPLAGLVTGVTADKSSETGRRYVYRIEHMALRLVPSPLEPGLRPSGASGEGSVIVADIDPNLDPSVAQLKPSRAQFATTPKPGEDTKGDGGLDKNGNWTILSYAEEEIKKLKATETLRYAQVWRKGAATEEQLLKLKSPRYLIISAHGYFTEKDDLKGDFRRSAMMSQLAKADDSMFRSGLVLSGANHADELRKNGKYDGLLTAADAARLNLRGTRLVVLSACQSGRGDFSAGMGVLGLRRAFRTAGAQGVVMSLFNVPEQSSAELMALFFKNVKEGSDNAGALRKAQLEMLFKKKMGPFHWAGFVYEGS